MRKFIVVLLSFALVLLAALPGTDAFTGTNGVVLSAHNASWTVSNGGFEINTNAVRSTAVDSTAFWGAETFSADQYAQATVAASYYDQLIGPAVRVHATALTGYYLGVRDNGVLFLNKYVSGVHTHDVAHYTGTVSNGDTIRLEASGTSLTVKLNGVTVIGPITDTDIATGKAGIIGGSYSGTARIDNWEGGDLSEAPAARRRAVLIQ